MKTFFNIIIGVAIGIVVSYFSFLLFDKIGWIDVFGKYASKEFGFIGSFLSGITVPFFGILSFAGILLTIIYQIRTSRLSREEQSLFELMKNQSEIVKNTIINITSQKLEGRECYSYLYNNKFKSAYTYQLTNSPTQGNKARIEDAFDLFYTRNKIHFEHNFRSISMVLKYINNSKLAKKTERAKYLNAQLSEYEIILFFYYGLSNNCDDELKVIIENLDFFNYLPDSELQNEDHLNEYNASA